MRIAIAALCIVVLAGCDSVVGKYAVDVDGTLAGIVAVPTRAQAKYPALDTYKAEMEDWLQELALDVKAFEGHPLDAPGKYTFRIDGYFRRNPLMGAVRVSEEDEKTTYEVWQWISGPVYEQVGTLEIGNAELVWQRKGGYWPIRFRKQ